MEYIQCDVISVNKCTDRETVDLVVEDGSLILSTKKKGNKNRDDLVPVPPVCHI